MALAQVAADAAEQAYDAFYTNIYEPAATKTPEMETTLTLLTIAREQTKANLVAAQQGLAALIAAQDNAIAITQATMARDQAYAAYLAALSQRGALRKASDVSGAVGSADAAIDAADAARSLANDILERAEIVAPVDGVVVLNTGTASALTGLGAAVGGSTGPTVGASVTPASAPFAIVSFESLLFTAQVDETDIARVEPGMKTVIELNGLPDVQFEAKVERVGLESVLTPTGGTAFPIHARFKVDGEQVLLGMNGSAEVWIETIGEAATMPIEALLEEDGASYVYTVRDGRARRVAIEVGRLTDTSVEILGGLDEGDKVIVSGVTDLEDGTKVRAE